MINFNHKKRETEDNIALTPIQNVALQQFSVHTACTFQTKLSNLHEIVILLRDSTPALEKIDETSPVMVVKGRHAHRILAQHMILKLRTPGFHINPTRKLSITEFSNDFVYQGFQTV